MNPESHQKSVPEKSQSAVKPSTALQRLKQTPWWAVSLAFHALAIALVSLISWTVVYHNDERDFVVTTRCDAPPVTVTALTPNPQEVLRSDHDSPSADPATCEVTDIVVPSDILAKAELGDHFESISPDHPDTHAALGNPDASLFHSVRGSNESAGGSGVGANDVDQLIGMASGVQQNTGGGFGGGCGTGVGVSSGMGKGSFGSRNGGGHRLIVRRSGGCRAVNSAKRVPDSNFALRVPSIDNALSWLAANQAPDGRWNCREHKGKSYDTAVTGLALLAFLRAGQSDTSGRYQKNVQRALEWLKSQQRPNGQLHDDGDKAAYSHAIAGLSLVVAAKNSKDATVRAAAENALSWSCSGNQPSDAWEAWRYSGAARDGDLSVTGWYLLQLASAKDAGLPVPETALQKARQFLNGVTARSDSGELNYLYRPGGKTNPRLTAIGGLCSQMLGIQTPDNDVTASLSKMFESSKPDMYGWYYGSLYGARSGGAGWPQLNLALQKNLATLQNRNGSLRGSWDPEGEYADQWGRVGQTALGVLCMETLHGFAPAARKLNADKKGAAVEPIKDIVDEKILTTVPAAVAEPFSGETYEQLAENGFTVVQGDDALSTFAIDVDTASYSNVRRILNAGQRPPKGAVRIEELINYFPYDYKAPTTEPFAVQSEIADCPWNPQHRLALVNLKGKEIPWDQRPQSNLVFLIDVSGSMSSPNRLPLVKTSLKMLVDRLGSQDSVGIVVYAGETGVRLNPTACDRKSVIKAAIDELGAGGGTNGGAGIVEAYRLASQNFIKGGTNRVILCTDGDFNIGISDDKELKTLITDKAKSGVFLSVMGFGMGNLKDSTLEMLADKGNGNYGYIDSEREAKKIMVDQIGGTLLTLCKDVKIQVEFNPSAVTAYRLVGYENRVMAAKEFRDDKKDAGELGSGHTVTALYEFVPGSSGNTGQGSQPLKYQKDGELSPDAANGEIFMVSVRHKLPEADTATEMNVSFADKGTVWKNTSANFRWAATIAMFGMQLRGSEHKGTCDWSLIRKSATEAIGADPGGYRAEFLQLIGQAEAVSGQPIPKDSEF